MSKMETGGPAYPFVVETGPDYYGRKSHKVEQGMTIRDQFAAHALNQAVMDYDRVEVHPNDNHNNSLLPYATKGAGTRESIIARQAYRYADAMLAARGGDRD